LAAAAFYPKVDRATVILPQQSRLELGCISAIDSNGQTIWIADAHYDDGKRFVVRADVKRSAFLGLESAIRLDLIPSSTRWVR
jgi:hypothetical protein